MESSENKRVKTTYDHKVEVHLCDVTGTPIGYIITTPNGDKKFVNLNTYRRLDKRFGFSENKSL
jgi:hypothetical protein